MKLKYWFHWSCISRRRRRNLEKWGGLQKPHVIIFHVHLYFCNNRTGLILSGWFFSFFKFRQNKILKQLSGADAGTQAVDNTVVGKIVFGGLDIALCSA